MVVRRLRQDSYDQKMVRAPDGSVDIYDAYAQEKYTMADTIATWVGCRDSVRLNFKN